MSWKKFLKCFTFRHWGISHGKFDLNSSVMGACIQGLLSGRFTDIVQVIKSIVGRTADVVIALIADNTSVYETIAGPHRNMIADQMSSCHCSVLGLQRQLLWEPTFLCRNQAIAGRRVKDITPDVGQLNFRIV